MKSKFSKCKINKISHLEEKPDFEFERDLDRDPGEVLVVLGRGGVRKQEEA